MWVRLQVQVQDQNEEHLELYLVGLVEAVGSSALAGWELAGFAPVSFGSIADLVAKVQLAVESGQLLRDRSQYGHLASPHW